MTTFVKNSLNSFDRGWIKAKDIHSSLSVYVCENIPLEKVGDHFLVLAGKNKNRHIKLENNFFGQKSFFNEKAQGMLAALIIRGTSLKFMSFSLELVEEPKITKGKYYIVYPDRPRKNTPEKYFFRNGSKFASTWFPILDENFEFATYLHTGTYSKGCLTVKIESNWDNLYNYLIHSISRNYEIIGELKVE